MALSQNYIVSECDFWIDLLTSVWGCGLMTRMTKRLAAKNEFLDRADEIRENYTRDPKRQATSPYSSPLGSFKRESYKLLRRTISAEGGHNVIKSVLKDAKVDPPRLNFRENQFHFGLLAIDPEREAMDPKRLSLFARQLTYADLHEVPAHFLVGFLHQSGSSASISKKLKADYREPWFGG